MSDVLNQSEFAIGVLEQIDMSVLVREANNQFFLVGNQPRWLQLLGECCTKKGQLKLVESDNFLENFIVEANKFWDKGKVGSVYSGIWTQFDQENKEQVFEAIATLVNNRSVLLIQKINHNYSEIRRVFQSVRENSINTEKIKQMAYIDELTGLYNRRGFVNFSKQQLDHACQNEQTVSMFCIDIDYLKQINDEYGHIIGDLAIKNSALLLKKSFRQNDCIGRIGGDEFLVLATNMEKPGAKNLVLRLNQNLAIWNRTAADELQLSLSIGYVFSESEGVTFEDLYHQADVNMYKLKQNRSCAVNAC